MADPDAEARFQEFINQPGSPSSRLRDAFAQLLAQGSDKAMPMEAVMAAQAQKQWPQNDLPLIRPRQMGDSMSTDLPMRAIDPGPAAEIAFPTAPGSALADPHFHPQSQRGQTDADQAPFHGRGSYAGAYRLPETTQKKKARR